MGVSSASMSTRPPIPPFWGVNSRPIAVRVAYNRSGSIMVNSGQERRQHREQRRWRQSELDQVENELNHDKWYGLQVVRASTGSVYS